MKSYIIYQVREEAKNSRYIMFSDYEFLQENGLDKEVKKENYRPIYSGEVEDYESDIDCLDELYMKFQGRKPEGYSGHSLSMSDVIVLDERAYYCDSHGWQEIENF